MNLTFEKNGVQFQTESPTSQDLEKVIADINALTYAILENKNGDYIQCTGSDNGLVIEARFYDQHAFKHFVLGNRKMSKIWHTVHTKVGPIRILAHEKMNIDNAKELFSYYYFNASVFQAYNKRDITKQFK